MTEAEKLFNEAAVRTQRWLTAISWFREVVSLALPSAETPVRKQFVDLLEKLPGGAVGDTPSPPAAPELRQAALSILSTEAATKKISSVLRVVDVASIVFAHSVLDGAALDYCRVVVLHAPNDCLQSVENRKVALSEVSMASYSELLRKELERFIEELEHASVLKKIDWLFARWLTSAPLPPMRDFTFDRVHLERLDRLRHEIVHGDGLHKRIENAAAEVQYLIFTSFLLMQLVSNRYGLKPDPEYIAKAMINSMKPES